MRIIVNYIIFFLFPILIFGQEFTYTQYDIKDGLAGSTVYSIAQDQKGFMWFGTETGLSRFDGTKFKNYSTTDGLPGTEILNLFPDSKGRIWIVPFKKSICYYFKDKIYSQDNDSTLKNVQLPGSILFYAENDKGNILILGQSYIIILDSSLKFVKQYSIKDFRSNYFVNCSRSRSGEFNVLCDAGLFSVNSYGINKIYKINSVTPHINSSSLSSDFLVYRVSLLQSSIVNLKSWDSIRVPYIYGLNKLNFIKDKFVVYNTPKGSSFFSLNSTAPENIYLPTFSVSNTFQDSEGNIWFSTIGNGVFRLNSKEIKSVLMKEHEGLNASVTSLYANNDSIYCGTNLNSIHKFHISDKSKVSRYFNQRIDVMLSTISDLIFFQNKYLLYGTGMNIIKVNRYGELIDTIGSVSVKQLLIDGDNLLAATGSHLLKVKVFDFKSIDTIWNGRTTCALFFNGSYYIGTVNGLVKKDVNGMVSNLSDTNPLLSVRITSIKRDKRGGLWVATFGNGIFYLLNDKIVHHFTENNGLSSNTCKSIYIDNSIVWVGTNRGLNRISLNVGDDYSIKAFYVSDGLASESINSILVHKDVVYVATPAGVSFFNDKLLGAYSKCILRWTSIKAGASYVDVDSVPYIRLEPKENSVRFDFVGISFTSNGDIDYQYRLLGLDSSWQNSNESFVSYPSLPSGDYVFQVKAVNKYGIPSNKLEVFFMVELKWWEKIWVKVLFGFILFLLLIVGVRLYSSYLQKISAEKNRINQRMAELEQLALRSQMNPHFIFNSLNSIQQYVMDKDIEGANRFISAFSKLIRQTLDFSSRSQITIQEEIEYLRNYLELEKTRLEDQFDYVIHVQDSLEMTSLFIPPMILQPYIENSIRHGVRYRHDGKGLIALSISIQENRLVCEIVDNGMGRTYTIAHKSAMPIEYQSKGMTLTENRVNILNKVHKESIEVLIEDAFPNEDSFPGTRVLLKFPL